MRDAPPLWGGRARGIKKNGSAPTYHSRAPPSDSTRTQAPASP